MEHPDWCINHNIYQSSESQPTHNLWTNLLDGN